MEVDASESPPNESNEGLFGNKTCGGVVKTAGLHFFSRNRAPDMLLFRPRLEPRTPTPSSAPNQSEGISAVLFLFDFFRGLSKAVHNAGDSGGVVVE